jgi:hypothetical protein
MQQPGFGVVFPQLHFGHEAGVGLALLDFIGKFARQAACSFAPATSDVLKVLEPGQTPNVFRANLILFIEGVRTGRNVVTNRLPYTFCGNRTW